MRYILDLLTWHGYARVTDPTPEQIAECEKLNLIEIEEDIIAVIDSDSWSTDYPALSSLPMELAD